MTLTNKPGDPTLPSPKSEIKLLAEKDKGFHKYSVEDFFRKPAQSAYKLSPGGDQLSFLGPYKRRLNLFVRKIHQKRNRRITAITDRDIAWYLWKTDELLLFAKDEGGNENYHLFCVKNDGSGLKKLTPFDGVRIDLIDDLEDEPDEVIIQMNKNNPQLFEPFRINIHTGALKLLAANEDIAQPLDSFMTDHKGAIRAASKLEGGTNVTLLARHSESDPFKEVLTTNFKNSVSPLFFDFDNGDVVYASSNLGRDCSALIRLNLSTGEEVGEPLFSHEEVDVTSLSYSKKRKVLTAISVLTARRQLVFLDEEIKQLYSKWEKLLPGYEIVVTSANKAEDKFLLRTYSDRSLGAYYFFDQQKDTLTKITDVSPWLDEADLAPMQPVQYQTRDGLTIHGYLSMPVGVPPKNLPVVINPHGGPWVRDVWGYNPEIQLMTNRGYAVLQMNYRGSTGYGRHFWETSFKQWGKKMQDDLSDGVKWLVEQGIADPAKVAIYGGSYGGYATLAGLTFTPELYACGIDYVGVSNLFTFMNTIPPYWKPYLEMMYEMVGNPEKEEELMRSASPVFHIDNIKVPLFVVQGANDPRVNIDESDQIVRALRQRKVDVLYMVKYDEGHGFHNEENQVEFYKAMLGFLEKYLKKA